MNPSLYAHELMIAQESEKMAITNISSMAQGICALKKDVYKNKPVEFAGGLTLNVPLNAPLRHKSKN